MDSMQCWDIGCRINADSACLASTGLMARAQVPKQEACSTVIHQCRVVTVQALCALMLLFGFCLSPALAQDETLPQGRIQLSVVSFGVGGLARAGDWAGIQIQVLDQGSSGGDVILRLAFRDEDGDETQYDRVITTNPGSLQSFWLYAWIPYRGADLEYELRAYEAIDTGNTQVGQLGFRAGKLLGTQPIYNPQIQPPTVVLAGVVGNNQLGMDQYGFVVNNRLARPYSHELIRTSPGLGVDNLPDRWQGLVSMDTLVWSNTETAASSPGRLSPEKARAIRTWVERGGHLVLVLPSSGDPWYSGAHPLRSILPEIATPTRREGVDLESYRSLLTESKTIALPDNAVVYAFEPLDSSASVEPDTDAIPVLNAPNGDCVVIRRLIGSGMVTVVGLPLNHGQLRRVGLPEGEAFWHRVLGQRGDIVRPAMMSDNDKNAINNRSLVVFDQGVSGEISKTGQAVQGIFFGIVVFALYWLIAGPVGYGLLKAKKLKQHAWVAFIATTGVFTALAWLGATTMRPKTTDITHLSFLEQVHGQATQRSRSWMSVMLPSYGTAVLSLDDPESISGFGAQESSNLLSPWSSPDTLNALTKGFPDNSGYRVESKNPNAIRVPTRATVKVFMSQWAGDARWSMPTPVGTPGDLNAPRLTIDGTVVSGQLVHNLPGPLKDVTVFVLAGEVPVLTPGGNIGRRSLTRTAVLSPNFGTAGWGPQEAIDLESITKISAETRNTRNMNYFESAIRYGVPQSGLGSSSGSVNDRLIASRFLSQLEPPRFNNSANDTVGDRLAQKKMLHGWDLGKWFTEPTLIIMGVVDIPKGDASTDGMPSPMWVNDRPVPASGKTIVTWIYPFEGLPPEFLGDTISDASTRTDSTDDTDQESKESP